MSIDLPLDSMTTTEKLQVLEAVWASLCREPVEFQSPDWHRRVLEERKQRLESGQATVSNWREAKQRFNELGR